MPRGGPDGGDGGRGGSVILEATNDVSDLSLYKQRPRWHAEGGTAGAGGRKTGKRGASLLNASAGREISVRVETAEIDSTNTP